VNRRIASLAPALAGAFLSVASIDVAAQAPGGGRTPPKPLPLATPRSVSYTATEGT
jgi:hypothetical protein